MTGLEDRAPWPATSSLHTPPARGLRPAREIAGIDLRTLPRWPVHEGLVAGDGRPLAAGRAAVRPVD